jgi:hypothetical protein
MGAIFPIFLFQPSFSEAFLYLDHKALKFFHFCFYQAILDVNLSSLSCYESSLLE